MTEPLTQPLTPPSTAPRTEAATAALEPTRPPQGGRPAAPTALARAFAEAEREDERRARRDRHVGERELWRAQVFRQLTHVLPGQRVLIVGAGAGRLLAPMLEVTRGECAITALGFASELLPPPPHRHPICALLAGDLPGPIAGGRFDHALIATLPRGGEAAVALARVRALLEPGGHLVAFAPSGCSAARRVALTAAATAAGLRDPLVRPYDFVPGWGGGRTVWAARHLSGVLESAPLAGALARRALLHARRPGTAAPPAARLRAPEALRGAVSVVIPCKNEEANVPPLVGGLLALFDDYLREVIVVDDASDDGTAEAVRALIRRDPRVRLVRRAPPCGVGRALADGFAAARGRWVLSLDGDFVELLPELRDVFEAAAGFDVVVGSRFHRHGVVLGYPLPKLISNRGFHALAQPLLGLRFRDLTNNLKLMRREVVERLRLTQPGFAANAETGLQPLLMGLRVKEVPVSWVDRAPGMGTSSFKLAKVGTGYAEVLLTALLARFGLGRYADLPRLGRRRATVRGVV